MSKYNGWTNRATWHAQMDFFAGMDFEQLEELVVEESIEMTAKKCEKWANEILVATGDFETSYNIEDVDWKNIADTMLIDFVTMKEEEKV